VAAWLQEEEMASLYTEDRGGDLKALIREEARLQGLTVREVVKNALRQYLAGRAETRVGEKYLLWRVPER